jgi:hypothetical protein
MSVQTAWFLLLEPTRAEQREHDAEVRTRDAEQRAHDEGPHPRT